MESFRKRDLLDQIYVREDIPLKFLSTQKYQDNIESSLRETKWLIYRGRGEFKYTFFSVTNTFHCTSNQYAIQVPLNSNYLR